MASFRGGIGRVAGVIEYDSAQLTQLRAQFVGQLLTILGDTRLLWMAQSGDTTTSTGKSLNQGTITWDATVAARLSALGLGYAQTFDGSANYGTVPDADIYSFGNGTTDSAFSVVALANVTNTAVARRILTKYNNGATAREWHFSVTGSDTLTLTLYDESVDKVPNRTSNAAITMGSWALFGATYSAATGGATAANDITLYQNGAVLASTATNDVSYVAMENLGASLAIGAQADPTLYFQGSLALVALCQKSLTASDHWAIKSLINYYFALSL